MGVTFMEVLNLSAALSYAKNGFKIIPLQKNSKIPCKTDDFQNGFHSATNNQETIFNHWNQEQFVSSNIGLKLGKEENIVVIDVDNKTNDNAGSKSLEIIERELQPMPPTYTVQTLSGTHLFYQYPKGVDINRQINAFNSIDILADGYCVTTPSWVDGKQYKKVSGSLLELAEFPSFLLPFLVSGTRNSTDNHPMYKMEMPLNSPVRQGKTKYTAEFLKIMVEGAAEGGRNNFLMRFTAKCLALGTDLETIYTLLLVVNDNFISPSLPEQELNTVFKSITKKHLKKVGC